MVIARINLDPAPFLIVGQLITGADVYNEIWKKDKSGHYETEESEELAVITTNSPLGSAAINSTIGNISYAVGKRAFSLTIEEIDQTWISKYFKK